MYDKDQYRKFEGHVMIEMGSVWVIGWWKSQMKKSNRHFRFFRPRFSSPNFPPSQSQDFRIRDIASSSKIFENLKFSKILDEDTISRIRGVCSCDGGGEEERSRWWKLRPKKIEDYEVGRFFFDIYRHLAEPDDEADWPRSMW